MWSYGRSKFEPHSTARVAPSAEHARDTPVRADGPSSAQTERRARRVREQVALSDASTLFSIDRFDFHHHTLDQPFVAEGEFWLPESPEGRVAGTLTYESDEITLLQRLRLRHVFIPTSDKEIALLATRRVLEYGGAGGQRYSVHPTIDPLLTQLSVPA